MTTETIASPPNGRVVAGRYELGELLGAGGMAEVYLAHDRRLDRPVAVKLLGAGFAADPEQVERFRREAQAAAGLNHPNVVAIYDWGQDGGGYYLVMEYVRGRNLKEVVRDGGPLPEGQALAIAADVAAALEAAHARGVVHRDVKPHNVMLDERGRVKVGDFGIAQAAGGTTLTRTSSAVLGSAHYLSPEQARGERVDARSDLYSLGALLFELLAGRPPYQGDAPLVVAMQHVNAPTPSLRAVRADVSPATDALVARAMAKDPAARFPNAAAMRAALEAARTNPGTSRTAVAAPAWVAPPVTAPRFPLWPLLAALGLAALVAFAAVKGRSNAAPPSPAATVQATATTAAPTATVQATTTTAALSPTTAPPTATIPAPTATPVPPAPPAAVAPLPPPAPAAKPEPPGKAKKKR